MVYYRLYSSSATKSLILPLILTLSVYNCRISIYTLFSIACTDHPAYPHTCMWSRAVSEHSLK